MFVIGHGTNFNRFVTTYAAPDKKESKWYKEFGLRDEKEMKLMNGEFVDVTVSLNGDTIQIDDIKSVFRVPKAIQMKKYYRSRKGVKAEARVGYDDEYWYEDDY